MNRFPKRSLSVSFYLSTIKSGLGVEQATKFSQRASGARTLLLLFTILWWVGFCGFHTGIATSLQLLSNDSVYSSMNSSETIVGSEVHEIARKGFNLEPAAYEKSRPSYPPEAVDCLVSHLRLSSSPQSHVVDLGAGSGKFTRLLVEANYHLTAVEPSPAMRVAFAQVLPTIPVLEGTAWSLPIETSSQDAVIVAQAFHWFADIKALREIHRVLKPAGMLGLIWNLEDREARHWVAKLRDTYEQYESNTPQYRLRMWKEVWNTEEAKKLFSPLESAHFSHVALCDDDMVWERVLSKSYIACLSDLEKKGVQQKVLDLLNQEKDVERDATGLIKYPYLTDVFWSEKLCD